MDWKRFKKIIIVVLIMINIVFLVYYVKIKMSDNNVSEETRKNVIAVLEKGNVILDENIFPDNIEEYSACYISRLISVDSDFANKLKGANGTVTEEDELFEIKPDMKTKTVMEEDDVLQICAEYMESCGINSNMYEKESVNISDGVAKVKYNLYYDEGVFFDSFLEFEVNEQGIRTVTGRNIIENEKNIGSYQEKLMPVESIIVGIRDDKKADKKIKVTSVDFGYYLGKSAGVYESVLSLPVWKVSFEDKSYLYYDARNGNLINM